MGFVTAMGNCFGCGKFFSFNPAKVPSIRSPKSGSREPVCRDCVNVANPKRIANGLPAIEVLPGAYEPAEESEVF